MTHVIRMPDDNVVKKILQFKVNGIRKRGRPRRRGTDSMESDFNRYDDYDEFYTQTYQYIPDLKKLTFKLFINVSLRNNTAAFGDRHRNFQPRSSDEGDISSAPHSPQVYTETTLRV
ncbi:hypothetical protein TNCV_1425421 [Trichonephila clavipes]|nr:hypothetical protein TNCV_1425421 [Trichonephila clavipes]